LFCQKSNFFVKNRFFCQKSNFLSKIEKIFQKSKFFVKNRNFLLKIEFFSQNPIFLKIEIFLKNNDQNNFDQRNTLAISKNVVSNTARLDILEMSPQDGVRTETTQVDTSGIRQLRSDVAILQISVNANEMQIADLAQNLSAERIENNIQQRIEPKPEFNLLCQKIEILAKN